MEIEMNTKKEEVTFFKWYEAVKDLTTWEIDFTSLAYNDDKKCVTIFCEGNEATTFWMEHSSTSNFTDNTPEGIRVLRALGRHLGLEGKTTTDQIVELIRNELKSHVLTLRMNKSEKGRLWSVLVQ